MVHKVDTTERLKKLRALMKENNVQFYVVPSGDAHFSEYTADCDERRAFISGFDGSAGLAVISEEKAWLFTDGRYFNQAGIQLDSNWTLMKMNTEGFPTWQELLVRDSKSGQRIGIDPMVIDYNDMLDMKKKLQDCDTGDAGEFVEIDKNLIDQVWGSERPPRPVNPIKKHDPISGTFNEKVEFLRSTMKEHHAQAYVVTALDEIAYLFNLRGSDIPYNPVFFSYAIFYWNKTILFIQDEKVMEKFEGVENVEIRKLEEFYDVCCDISKSDDIKKVLMSNRVSWAVINAVSIEKALMLESIVALKKAVKTPKEIEGMKNCHIRDGAALVNYLAWLERELKNGSKIDEVQGATKLEEYRSKQDKFTGLSFCTISSVGPNAAIIHYKPEAGDCATIKLDDIYLVDSGGQYNDGTTDITRTWFYGDNVSDEIKQYYTLVLKGHLAMENLVFPRGTHGLYLDCTARQFLWSYGLDYLHGTGHGVGSYLNVHEMPVGLGSNPNFKKLPLAPNQVLSNEPGVYLDGKYGFRLENLVIVKEVKTKYNFANTPYYGFETISWAPLCLKLVDVNLLTKQEIEAVNKYHATCFEKLKGSVDAETLEWLKKETKAI